MPTPEVMDLTRGVYRRQYAGFLKGRRINSISLEAEAWFWRVNCVADDFGNLDGDPWMVLTSTVGRRAAVTVANVGAWLEELVGVDLLRRYDVGGEPYLHVVGFGLLQPGAKNGRRIRRYPQSPWEEMELAGVVSGGIRGNPGESGGYENENENENETSSGEPANAASPDDPAVLEFPTCRGRRGKETAWTLRGSFVSELAGAFPAVDVPVECRKALAWVGAKPAHRKTAGGMKAFLLGWMGRAQDRPSRSAHGANGAVARGKSVTEVRVFGEV